MEGKGVEDQAECRGMRRNAEDRSPSALLCSALLGLGSGWLPGWGCSDRKGPATRQVSSLSRTGNQAPTAGWELDQGRPGHSAVVRLELERNQAPRQVWNLVGLSRHPRQIGSLIREGQATLQLSSLSWRGTRQPRQVGNLVGLSRHPRQIEFGGLELEEVEVETGSKR